MSANALTSACAIVVAGLARDDKEKLLRQLARECGYQLQPVDAREDFRKKFFLDDEEKVEPRT